MTATPTPSPKPLLCRLNIHHRWRVEHAPEGGNFRRCTRCGKDDPGGFSEGRPGDIIAGGWAANKQLTAPEPDLPTWYRTARRSVHRTPSGIAEVSPKYEFGTQRVDFGAAL